MDMSTYTEIPTIGAAKRLGVQWNPWMDDWFTSWSPRNSNSNAEGTWDHWVVLALSILADPLTKLVNPEAASLVEGFSIPGRYDESPVTLTEAQLQERHQR